MKLLRNILSVLAALSLAAACADEGNYLDELLSKGKQDASQSALQVTSVRFEEDYKRFSVDTRLSANIGQYSLSDPSQIRIEAAEYDHLGELGFSASQPKLERVTSIGAAQIVAADLKMLVLVDLTLPQPLVDKERDAVKEMSTLFTNDNLYVTFIGGGKKEGTVMLPSEYVLNNYFRSVQTDRKPFFSSVSRCLDAVLDERGVFCEAKEQVLMVLSDANLFYDGAFDVEDGYFSLKSGLIAKSLKTKRSQVMYYVDIDSETEDDGAGNEGDFLQTLCANTGGRSFDSFDWVAIEDDIFNRLDINYTDYRFDFINPDRKIYSGFTRTLKINCYHCDKLIASCSTDINQGSFFSPIIVNSRSTGAIVLSGLFIAAYILLVLYLVLQFAIPHISYFLFRRKCVRTFTDSSAVVNGFQVGESCYYCKAPFKEGDTIVSKCKHTMHESCWEENGGHCPEYGRNCPHGSHYFNKSALFDSKNAPYYSKWIYVAFLAAVISWAIYMLRYDYYDYNFLMNYSARHGADLKNTTFLVPLFGYMIVSVTALGFSWIAIRKRDRGSRLLEALLRSQAAAIVSYLAFSAVALVMIASGREGNLVWVDLIPWLVSGLSIAFFSTLHTNYSVKGRSLVIIVLSSVAAVLFWSFLSIRMSMDYRGFLLVLFSIFTLGLAAGMAQMAPRSERYFLRTSADAKQMDIAIYKWFQNSPQAVVSIGRSIDCSIEMAWDSSRDIAPKAAEIRQLSGVCYLYVLDGTVSCGRRTLGEGARIRLYSGRSFTIGGTTFTYQERDV